MSRTFFFANFDSFISVTMINIIHILVLVVLYRNESKILPQCMTISHKITIAKSLSVKEKIHKITCPTGPIV